MILFIIIIYLIIILLEKVILTPKVKEELPDYLYYSDLTKKINKMNAEKMQCGYWNYTITDFTIINKFEFVPPKENKKRILVVGDSFVWGWAQPNINNVWWKQLNYIIKQNGYNNVDIVAAGMNGFSLVDETEKIILNKEYIDMINPDLIIIGFVGNDWEIMDAKDEYFVKDLMQYFDSEFYINENITNKFLNYLKDHYPNIYNKVIELLLNKEYSKQNFKDDYGYSYSEKKKLYLTDKYIERIEKRGIEPLTNIDIPLFIVNLPFDSSLYNNSTKFKNKIFSLLDKYKIDNYDLEKYYNKEFKGLDYIDLQVNSYDYHPNTRLMNFYSNQIYKIIEEKYSYILGDKSVLKYNELDINDYLPLTINLNKLNNNEYTFTYPYNLQDILYYNDTNETYVKLNLEYPKNLKKLVFKPESGYISCVKVKYYDENLGYESNEELTLNLISLENNEYIYDIDTNKKITSIQISCNAIIDTQSTIYLKIYN